MKYSHEVIVVGASLAGASLAAVLGQRGYRVALIDKAHFPRPKPCGEGLSHIGLSLLKEFGIYDRLATLPQRPYLGFALWGKGRARPTVIDVLETIGVGIQRRLLDNAILQAALQHPSVEYFPGLELRSAALVVEPEGVKIAKLQVSAPLMVLADGVHSALAPKLGFVHRSSSPRRYGMRLVWQGTSDPLERRVSVFVFDEYEVYCTPVGAGALSVAIVGGKSVMREMAHKPGQLELQELLKRRIGFSGDLAERPLGIGPLGAVSTQAWRGPVLLAGDSLESIDPLGGMGMSHAFACAKAGGCALRHMLEGGLPRAAAMAEYTHERERAMRPLRGFTRIVAKTFRHILHRPIFDVMSKVPIMATVERALDPRAPGMPTAAVRSVLELTGAW